MKVVYHAASVIDAQLVVDLLAASGVPAHVQGSYLSGAIGELPAGEMVRVWVTGEHFEQAKQTLDEQWHGVLAEPGEPIFERSWRRAWTGAGAEGTGEPLRDRLLAAWSEPQRQYHTLQHLEESLWSFEAHADLARRPAEIELALWFHDAIYEVRASDNEQRSAEWAVTTLTEAGVDAEVLARVQSLVMATRHRAAPGTPDEALLVDIDLSILGAEPERFDEYEVQVRQEYAWVPGTLFRRKRRALLEDFLARPSIFWTPAFHDAFEARARENIARSLVRLRPWYRFWAIG